MKRLFLLLLLIPLTVFVPLGGQKRTFVENPDSASQMMAAFTGGSIWTSGTTRTCIWYFPVLGSFPLTTLFAPGISGLLAIYKEHAYFIRVSDWRIETMFLNSGFGGSSIDLARVPAGMATVYYSAEPNSRDWSDTSQRSTWGVPIATFARGGGLFQSRMIFSLPISSIFRGS